MKIPDQFLILRCAHIVSPHDLRVVDVCFVVHPFGEWIVIGLVAHDYQLVSGEALQIGQHRCSPEIFRS